VFLFDEPLSNLDAKLRVQMRVELKRLHERLETTAIYVTHDQVEAMTLGDRVVVMKDGCVQQVGEPLELYGRPANKFVAGFIGSPAMNFVEVAISASATRSGPKPQGLRLQVPSRSDASAAPGSADPRRAAEACRIANGVRSTTAFATAVDVLEPLGNEILLNFRAGGVPMVARVDPGRAREGAREHPPRARPGAPALLRRQD
jgi:multiple sugar transport system ATP-binding protein